MVSLFILSIGITASATIISNSIQQNSINKNKIVALNLAREGIEAVRIMRDTNWLRYGESARICWNYWANRNQDTDMNETDEEWTGSDGKTYYGCMEDTSNSGQNIHPIGLANNPDGTKTKVKSYVALFDPKTFQWMLVENFFVFKDDGTTVTTVRTCDTGNLGLPNGEALTSDNTCSAGGGWDIRKNSVDLIKTLLDGDGSQNMSRLYIDGNTGLYTHKTYYEKETNGTPGIQPEEKHDNDRTDFFREIFIRYPVNIKGDGFVPLPTDVIDASNVLGKNAKALDNQITVESKVWFKGASGKMESISLETELTDYFSRTNWYE